MKTVILTILVFGVIIMLHESGHFLFAKLFHVKVEEFSFGMGPKLWSRIKRGTQYTIRAFPIGGYVAMEGEDDAGSGAVVREKIVSAAEGGPLYEKPAWQRFIIMAAGAVMNVILGFIILIVVTAMSGLIGTTTVAVFDEDSVSANYLQAGDEIIKVNGYNTRFYGDATFQMLRDQDGTIDFTLIRDGEVMEVMNQLRDLAYTKIALVGLESVPAGDPAAVSGTTPGATAARLPEPCVAMPTNALITPSTVPKRPMSGLTEPIVASHGRCRPSRSRSAPASVSRMR